MIWVTGDKHGQLSAMELPDYKKIKKNDTLLICGDFGFIWDHSRAETKTLKALNKRKYTIAFVDGCHENFELLESYPIVEFHGGKARQIMPNIFQLMRGEVYEIEGKKILAFGGGSVENTTGDLDQNWENVEPTKAQIDNAVQHIKQVEGAVDIIYDTLRKAGLIWISTKRMELLSTMCWNRSAPIVNLKNGILESSMSIKKFLPIIPQYLTDSSQFKQNKISR